MRRNIAKVPVVITLFALLALAADNTPVADKIRTGNFIYVTTSFGNGDGENLSPTPEDRQAVSRIEREFRDWLRYKTVKAAKMADIVMVARTGRRPGSPSVTIGNDPRHKSPGAGLPPINGPFPGSTPPLPKPTKDDSANDDYLMVFDANALDSAPPIWQSHMRNGFGPDMALFKRFQRDVEGR